MTSNWTTEYCIYNADIIYRHQYVVDGVSLVEFRETENGYHVIFTKDKKWSYCHCKEYSSNIEIDYRFDGMSVEEVKEALERLL